MPRQAFSSLPSSKRGKAGTRREARTVKRGTLDALSRAEASNTEKPKIKRHRLGELDEEGGGADRSTKRQKTETGADDVDEEITDDGGSDSEGNEWHYGMQEDDEDSEIDSDEAFGESDEERYEGFTFRGSSTTKAQKPTPRKAPKRPTRELDLAEDGDDLEDPDESGDDGEDSDDLGDEAVDLATALDMNIALEKEEEEERQKGSKKTTQSASDEDSNSEGSEAGSDSEGDEDEDDSRSSAFSVSDNEGDNPGDHSKLLNFVEDLNAQHTNAKDKPRSNFSSYMYENPSEFGVRPTKKLTAADLLPTITDPRLRQSLKMLHNAEKIENNERSGGIPGKLAPPLAKRQQDRLDRGAAYEKSKETLNRWIDSVKQNRRAEHISFPLPDPDAQSALGSKQLLPTTTSVPVTDLESAIHNIMVESGLADNDGKSGEERLRAFEELQEKKLPLEEVQARRAELRKARDLLYREEIKAKRVKKIKSKAYRRVHRKERDKAAQEERAQLAAAGILNSDEEQEKNDRRRAEERMGARHRESRWAKAAKATGMAAWDDSTRAAVGDLARRDDELRRRIEGKGARNSDDENNLSGSESDDDASSYGSDDGQTESLARSLKKLGAADEQTGPGSRLNSMKFMQKAEAARRAANDAEIRQLRQEIGDNVSASGSDDENEQAGRQRFGKDTVEQSTAPKVTQTRNEFEAPLSGDDEGPDDQDGISADQTGSAKSGRSSISSKALHKKSTSRQQRPLSEKPAPVLEDDTANIPWLSGQSASKKKRSDRDDVVLASALVDHGKSTKNGAGQAKLSAKGRSQTNGTMTLAQVGDDEQDSGAEDQPTRNEALVQQAFAGDDVLEDFSREKEETVREEGDQVVHNGLPGWGSWGGEGISKKALKAQKRKQAHLQTTIKGVQADKRKDSKLDRVIINEKKVKKNGKYLANELPHPFESRQQYERSLRLPLGPEWTTKNTFQDATKPRVLMKQGVIKPMERPMV